ncbi:helix-turn-helix transcriptional regulator [Caloramator sp. ALD01]|uniref:helix-turn-helix transcriptional regulator n=1 Tax=Caloramator sp. ALD01 TaxID=1031288 RepID=UPI0004128B21|nr:helix-turn-helix transcriptional regulator [Caloramator sp. ALD01]
MQQLNIKNLKELRKKNKLTQKQMAMKLGISERAYQHYEYGKRKPNLIIAKKIAEVFGCSIDEIFFNQENCIMKFKDNVS